MITTTGIQKFAAAMAKIVSKGTITVNGQTKNVEVHSVKVEGDTFFVNLYLDDTVVGTITATKLYDFDGTLLADRPDSIVKPADKGLLIVFKFKLSEVTP
ncbi:MAG: hypothetical protein RSE04_06065 [Hydrogenoanaerobacterium sp.]